MSLIKRATRHFVKERLSPHHPREQTIKGVVSKQYIKRFIPDDPIIVEAGAHLGWDTIEMSTLWSKGIIHAFEPVPDLYGHLQENTNGLENVRLYPCALSDKTGIANLFVSSGSSDASSSLLRPKEHLSEHPTVYFEEAIDVPTITLNQWAKENRVEKVDLLWLDMQGYELAMLRASCELLRTVSAIYTEVSLKKLYEGTPLYSEVREWCEEQGFEVEREELAWADAGNVLFVRNKNVF
ncbi:MAG: FkbM family methyltransferase [Acidobacteriota bacterium]